MKYVLLDISGIIYRSFFALNKDKFHRSDGFPTNAILGTINILKQLNKKFPEYIFISCRDSKRSELLRSQETDSYKQNRKSADPILVQQFEHIYKSIEAMNITTVKCVGYEADVDADTDAGDIDEPDDMVHLPCCHHPPLSLVEMVDDDGYVESKNESEEDKVTKSMIIKLGHDLVHRLMGECDSQDF